jgi:hypothetical protein
MSVPPQEVCPFSAQHSFDYTTFLPGLQQLAEKEVSENCNFSWATSGIQFPSNSLTWREFLTGMKTFLFHPIGLTTRFFNPML